MILRKTLLAVALSMLPLAVSAQNVAGGYVSLGAGVNDLATTKLSSAVNGKLAAPNLGFSGEASLGHAYGNGLRAEAELLGLVNSQKVKATGVSGSSGSVTYGAMVNGLYDVDLGVSVTPYVGAGVGYVGVQQRALHAASGAHGTTIFNGDTGTLGSVAVQGIVGVAIPLSDHVALTAEYRLLDKLQARNVGGVSANLTAVAHAQAKVGAELDHSALVGLRFALDTAPAAEVPMIARNAAPAPAPAQQEARSYMVFFDWDKADLNARALQIIAEAAHNATRGSVSRIDVAGHADRTGTPSYNQTLSLTRANNVAAELIRQGVSRSAIVVSGYGDTRLLVPTAAGVREPRNRRVEIVLH